MIPSDLLARLRLMNDTIVQPLAVVQGIPAGFPEFRVGQRFVAHIEADLGEGRFRALVDGKPLNLSLPESAKPGDTLELIVLERRSQEIVAGRAEYPLPAPKVGERFPAQVEAVLPDGNTRVLVAGRNLTLSLTHPASKGETLELVILDDTRQPAVAGPAPAATLSGAGRLIGTLLARRDATAQPAQIRGTTPLLPQPSPAAAAIAPALRQAIEESGLFYESHQAQWIAGRRPLEALQVEPQARHAPATSTGSAMAMSVPAAPTATFTATSSTPRPETSTVAEKIVASAGAAIQSSIPLPEELQPLVQQQLDAAATQQIVWRGEIWPGQIIDWEIVGEEPKQREPTGAEEATQWRTRLRLTLPALGEVSATLNMNPAGVNLELSAVDSNSARVLDSGRRELSDALAAAGVSLLSMQVMHDESA